MSDWDDFMFYENERLANGGIPIEGDPFNDPADFIEEEEEEEEEIPEGTREYTSPEDAVCSFVLNSILNFGYQPDWSLEFIYQNSHYFTMEILPWKRTSQRPHLIPLSDLVSQNDKGDYIPDLDKIRNVLEKNQENF